MECEITHRCGHRRIHTIMGLFAADIDREAGRLARRLCPACVRPDDPRREPPAGLALPELTGTARQVAWAETLRAQRLAALHRIDPGAVAMFAAIRDAGWWIEHRAIDPGVCLDMR